jgi:hypothetical protein
LPLARDQSGNPLAERQLGDRRLVPNLCPEPQAPVVQQEGADIAIPEPIGQPLNQRVQQPVEIALVAQQD